MEKHHYDSTKIANYLYEKDYENKICIHCNNSMPKFVSINNSLLICSLCYRKHLILGYNISYVRALADEWDPYLLSFLERGGNSLFKRLIKKYNLKNIPIEKIFNTRIVEYYRLLIKSEVLADEPPNEIDPKHILDNIDNNIIYFPEFKNYKIFKGNILFESNNNSSLINLFRYIGSGAYYIHKTFDENDIYKKSLENTKILLKGVKEGGKLLYKTTKPVFKYLSIKTIQGIGYLCRKAIDELNEDNKDENIESNFNIDANDFCNVDNYIITPNLDFPTFEEIMMASENENYNHNENNNYNIKNNNIVENPNLILQKKDTNDIIPMKEYNNFVQEDINS